MNPFDDPDHADEILETLDDICKDLGLTFFLFAGTALGFYREDNYLLRDNDIDAMIIATENDYLALVGTLVKHGFRPSEIEHSALYHFTKYGILLDLRRSDLRPPWIVGKNDYECWGLDTVKYGGRYYRVPWPIETYLEHQYGDWQTPKFREVK